MPRLATPSARWIAGGAAILLAAAAFLIWGPPGLGSGSPPGNGPLFIGSYGIDSGPGDGREQIGIIIPILSSSHSTIVIDGMQLIGGAGYPAPRFFALRVIDYNRAPGRGHFGVPGTDLCSMVATPTTSARLSATTSVGVAAIRNPRLSPRSVRQSRTAAGC